jgi:hypothetical protein
MKRTASSDCHGSSPTLRAVIPAKAVRTMYSFALMDTMPRRGTLHSGNHSGVALSANAKRMIYLRLFGRAFKPKETICRCRCLGGQLVHCFGAEESLRSHLK